MKIKVNGIRVNKTTGCLGNSVPCPTHSSLAFTFLQSLESNNTLLTEGPQQAAVQHFQIVFEQESHTVRRCTRTVREKDITKGKIAGRGKGFFLN